MYVVLYFHNRTGTVLVTDNNARRTDILVTQKSTGRAHDMFGVVVYLGQMRHYQGFQPFMGKFMQQRERFLVGDMSVTGFDTLLQLPRIWPIHQHLYIVIRLQVEKAATAQFFGNQAGNDAEVGN